MPRRLISGPIKPGFGRNQAQGCLTCVWARLRCCLTAEPGWKTHTFGVWIKQDLSRIEAVALLGLIRASYLIAV